MGKYVGAEFRRIREAHGLSQNAVSRRASGVSRTTIVQMENGRSVKLETLRILAAAMKARREEWLALVIAWVRDLLGEDLAGEIGLKPRAPKR
jgi:transcriptional regulator with XRE-family HTH domain